MGDLENLSSLERILEKEIKDYMQKAIKNNSFSLKEIEQVFSDEIKKIEILRNFSRKLRERSSQEKSQEKTSQIIEELNSSLNLTSKWKTYLIVLSDSEVPTDTTVGDRPWYYWGKEYEGIDGIKLFITYLLIEFDVEVTKPLNDRLIDRFTEFGNNIGEESLIVRYVIDDLSKDIDYKRCVEFIRRFGLKLRKAPYIVFSKKPLEKVEDKDEIFALSFKITDEEIFKYLYNSFADYALKGVTPKGWNRIVSWAGRNSKILMTIWNGLRSIAVEIGKEAMKPKQK